MAGRDVERRIQIAEDQIDVGLPYFDAPQGGSVALRGSHHMKLMLDLQVLAFQEDLTRVISLW